METLTLKNFAKLKDTILNVNDITLIAGKPGSGKSYIMKMLYAMYEANDNLSNEIKKEDYLISKFLNEVMNEGIKLNIEKQKNKKGKIDKKLFKELADSQSFRELLKQEIVNAKEFTGIKKTLKEKQLSDNEIFYDNLRNIIKSVFDNYSQISDEFIFEHDNCLIEYKNTKLNIERKSDIKVKDAVFVETPLILEFKSFMTKDLNKIPYHISSLLKILDKDYSFIDEKQEEFIEEFINKSKEIINGNIENSGDSFIYRRGDKNYDIVNASSGIKSIGLLQYLVTNKALKKDSVLFWEEPEVHLHPSWQLKMVELFLELQKNGVRIVFSTHSPYMADYLNALVKKRKLEDKVSFNLLTEEDGVVENIILNDANWNLLQKEFLSALEDIMWEYL